MSLESRKIDIISWVTHLKDEEIVSKIEELQILTDHKNDDLPQELKFALDKGLGSLEQGKSSSHEVVMSRMKKKYPSLIK